MEGELDKQILKSGVPLIVTYSKLCSSQAKTLPSSFAIIIMSSRSEESLFSLRLSKSLEKTLHPQARCTKTNLPSLLKI